MDRPLKEKNTDQFKELFVMGDIVTALGSSIMVVYQDKKIFIGLVQIL